MSDDLRTLGDTGRPARTVTLQQLATRCGGGDCPTVYRTDRGTLVVQGYVFQPADAGVALASGEQMVEIPIDLLAEVAQELT